MFMQESYLLEAAHQVAESSNQCVKGCSKINLTTVCFHIMALQEPKTKWVFPSVPFIPIYRPLDFLERD